MSKVIKLQDMVYYELEKLRTGRETFSDVIVSLLRSRIKMLECMNVLEGQLKFREWQREQETKRGN